MIYGEDDDDILHGDGGDDIIVGGNQTALKGDVIHGGPGNDMLTAGNMKGTNDTTAPSGAYSYVYGDGGNDTIWGEDGTTD